MNSFSAAVNGSLDELNLEMSAILLASYIYEVIGSRVR